MQFAQERGASAPLFVFRGNEGKPERDGWTHAISTALAGAPRIPDNLRFTDECFSARQRWPAPKREASEMASPVNAVKRLIAYFSMEIALENAMPSYSGGLGVLAGDTIRAAADLRLPMVAVSLLYRKGFFTQRLS